MSVVVKGSVVIQAETDAALCTGYGIEIHHVVKRSQGGSNDPENLLFLCRACHAKTETNPADAVVAGFLKPSWTA